MKPTKPKAPGTTPQSADAGDTAAREVRITRLIHAPRELVWEAYTDPKHIGEWWGPKGFTITTQEIAIKKGGTWRFTMHGPDGTDFPNLIVYQELKKPERIVLKHGGLKVDGPGSFVNTITMEARGKNTQITLLAVFSTAAERDEVVKKYHAIEGGNQTLDRLEAHLEQMGAKAQARK